MRFRKLPLLSRYAHFRFVFKNDSARKKLLRNPRPLQLRLRSERRGKHGCDYRGALQRHSGPAGERDWNRLRSLFLPDARLTAVHKKSDGSFSATSVTVEGYIERAGKYFREKPFTRASFLRRVEKFGQEAHVFSTYESREAPDAKPFYAGINSIQLFTTASAGIA